MYPYLITINKRRRVEPDPNDVVRATVAAQNMQATLWILGTSGKRYAVNGENVAKYTNEQYMTAAQQGMLYVSDGEVWGFCADFDRDTGAPVLMEKFDDVFARRSKKGPQAAEQQAATNETLNLNS
jgi:hypothetical protein